MANARVSQRDIYELVQKRFDRLEDKMDRRITSIEKRVDVLEDFRSYVIGIITLLGFFVGGFATWVIKKVTGER